GKGPSPSLTPHLVPRGGGLVVPDPSTPHHCEQVPSRASDGGEPRFHMRRNSGFTANPGPESGTSRPSTSSDSPVRSAYQPHTPQATMPRRRSLSPLNRPNGAVPCSPGGGVFAPAADSA